MKTAGRHEKNLKWQQWTGSNGNLWSQPYEPPWRNEDYVHPIHRVRIPYSKFSSLKTCLFIDKSSFKMGHMRLSRFFSLSHMPMMSEGHWYTCVHGHLEILWCHKYANEENMRSLFTCLLQWNFVYLYTSWYRCLLHNIIFWQNFIWGFHFLTKKRGLKKIVQIIVWFLRILCINFSFFSLKYRPKSYLQDCLVSRYFIEANSKQKAVANCVWMLVVKIEGIERIY